MNVVRSYESIRNEPGFVWFALTLACLALAAGNVLLNDPAMVEAAKSMGSGWKNMSTALSWIGNIASLFIAPLSLIWCYSTQRIGTAYALLAFYIAVVVVISL